MPTRRSTKTSTDIERIKASRERWQRRLRRAVNAIAKLDAREKRIERRTAVTASTTPTRPRAHVDLADPAGTIVPAAREAAQDAGLIAAPAAPAPQGDGLDLPTFLQRARPKTPADQAAAEQIVAERADLKRRKKAGQDAKRKAKDRGELRRMPLQGRAALAAIRGQA